MTLQELQAAIESYRLTITNKKEVQQLEDSYEFHYWDEETDEGVSIPIKDINHLHQLIDSLK